MKHILTKSTLVALSVAAWIALPGGATALSTVQEEDQEHINQSFDIGPDGSLTLGNVSGDIKIQGGSGSQVEVRAVKEVRHARSSDDARRQLERVEIEISHTGNRLRVSTHYEQGDRDRDTRVSVKFDVTVPYGTEVSVKSVSGDVQVADVKGELRAESVSGEVTVRNADQLAEAKSVSGSVEIQSAKGSRDLEVSSVSGDVEINGLEAVRASLSTVSGDVEITDALCERASLSTVSGDVRYIGKLAPSGRYEFKSHSGDVRIGIPGDTGFEIEAESFSGEIESDFPLTVHSIRGDRRKLSGVYGDGSAIIEATTFSGDVTIQER
jgi:DUF4097 and DUF4098 domain-containing protein YvlB